jgi:hypothetical protein
VVYELSPKERRFHSRLRSFLERAEVANVVSAADLLAVAASSLNAVERPLRQLASRLVDSSAEEGAGSEGASRSIVTDCERLLTALENIEDDSKLEALLRLAREQIKRRRSRINIYTEYEDSVGYLAYGAEATGMTAYPLSHVQDFATTQSIIDRASAEPGLVITTSAFSDLAALTRPDCVIHFDLPANARALHRRIGPLESVKRGPNDSPHFVLVDGVTLRTVDVDAAESLLRGASFQPKETKPRRSARHAPASSAKNG